MESGDVEEGSVAGVEEGEGCRGALDSLVPGGIEDETAGCLYFVEEFKSRYGHHSPHFVLGTLHEAYQQAFYRSPAFRKLLVIYMHHENSYFTHTFCTQVLCSDGVLRLLDESFVVWGWDVTERGNKAALSRNLGERIGMATMVAMELVPEEELPAMLVCGRDGLLGVLSAGRVDSGGLLAHLVAFAADHEVSIAPDVAEELRRREVEELRREQDQAYQESLDRDRAKDERDQERKRDAVQEVNEAWKRLPPEPPDGSGDSSVTVRIRTPQGIFSRSFSNLHPLQTLFDYLIVRGFPVSEYKVILLWPRKDLTTSDPNITFKDLNFHSQQIVFIEPR